MKASGPRIAFQGERGAFSEQAARRLLGDRIRLVPRPTFESLFHAIKERAADCLLVPIENSLAGSVQRTYDLLLASSLVIVGEVIEPIAHHLIACRESSLAKIRSVESHPVALAQCERFFARHKRLRRIANDDTAGSVRAVVASGDPTRAAIAGFAAAEVYGGRILQKHIEDHAENYTRFLLLSSRNQKVLSRAADKISLGFRLPHRPGALRGILAIFAERKINLVKIESRPLHGRPWEYCFYLDLQVSPRNPALPSALRELKRLARSVRILGHYPSARSGRSARHANNGKR
jgi:prephenate dehydratase